MTTKTADKNKKESEAINMRMPRLKQRHGNMSIEASVFLLVVMAVLSLIMSIFPVFNRASTQNAIAHDLVRFIELRGTVDSDVYAEFERLKKASGIDCSLSITADNPSKIQFGDEFTVTLTSKAKIGMGGIISVPVRISSVASGRSERYWK